MCLTLGASLQNLCLELPAMLTLEHEKKSKIELTRRENNCRALRVCLRSRNMAQQKPCRK
jgi:hypothetical protein